MSDTFWDSPRQIPTDFPQAIEIDQHSGPRVIPFLEGKTIKETIYHYIRCTHHFLTDENHDVDLSPVDDPENEWMTYSVTVIRNSLTPPPIWSPSWAFNSPGDSWFTVYSRLVSPQTFDRDYEHNMARIPEYLEEAEAQRDTVRGRKRRKELEGFAKSAQSTANWYLRRKQDFLDGKFFDPVAYQREHFDSTNAQKVVETSS